MAVTQGQLSIQGIMSGTVSRKGICPWCYEDLLAGRALFRTLLNSAHESYPLADFCLFFPCSELYIWTRPFLGGLGSPWIVQKSETKASLWAVTKLYTEPLQTHTHIQGHCNMDFKWATDPHCSWSYVSLLGPHSLRGASRVTNLPTSASQSWCTAGANPPVSQSSRSLCSLPAAQWMYYFDSQSRQPDRNTAI